MALQTCEIRVTVDADVVRTLPAEFVAVPFGRGAPIGMTDGGTLYAGFSTEVPGIESILLASTDGGRTWSEKRLDWWQFLDHTAERDSPRTVFWENRWATRNDSFGVLKNGALLWAFLQNPDSYGAPGMDEEGYVIRSEDGGETWEGPAKVDRYPFPSIGCASNRMTELPDGTVLWPQRLGLTSAECARIGQEIRNSGRPWEGSPFCGTHVFRSTDGGRSWGDRTPLPDWGFETTLLRLHSGRLIAAIRHQPPFLSHEPLSDPVSKRVCLADSDDDGRTWSDFRTVRRTPDGPTDLAFGQCHGELSQLSDGTLVLTHDHRYPYDTQQLFARVSRDEGQTWTPEVYHLTRAGGSMMGSSTRGTGSGYASSVVLDDDTIVTMTGTGTCMRWRVA